MQNFKTKSKIEKYQKYQYHFCDVWESELILNFFTKFWYEGGRIIKKVSEFWGPYIFLMFESWNEEIWNFFPNFRFFNVFQKFSIKMTLNINIFLIVLLY